MDLLPGPGPTLDLRSLRERLSALAAKGVYVGTSSWKYPGWIGQLYDEQRYLYRGKISEARFQRTCLEEYAEVFPTVCVDAGYYQFPTPRYVEGLAKGVPAGFRFSFKVTEEITAASFINLPRYGPRAGRVNDHFLDPALFAGAFLKPLEAHRDKIGMLIFEFSRFRSDQIASGGEFVERLEGFLAELPAGWSYGVEIRNRTFLHPDYFAALARHGVAHVFNNWTKMPPVSEQIALPGAFTADGFGARFLLTPGRAYQEAVDAFQPYRDTRAADPDARAAGTALMSRAPKGKSYLYVNNRLEGNAIKTILAMIDGLGA